MAGAVCRHCGEPALGKSNGDAIVPIAGYYAAIIRTMP
jgi:hypothetical protein